jgi:transposase
LSRWFQARVGAGKGRIRRIAIVALARKLLGALWRYVTQGVVPEGAVLKAGMTRSLKPTPTPTLQRLMT